MRFLKSVKRPAMYCNIIIEIDYGIDYTYTYGIQS